MVRFIPKSIFGFGLILALCIFSSCRKNDDAIIHINPDEFTAEDQRIIGLRLKETILGDTHNFPVLDLEDNQAEEKVEAYLNSLIKTLAVTAPVVNRNNFDWSITVIDNDEDLNLFAAPGGHFFIYSGLLKYLESENELLGVLAHEMLYTDKGILIDELTNAFSSEELGDVLLYNTVAEIENMALWLRDASFSEKYGAQADSFAVNIMCPFLFDAGSINTFLDRAEREERNISWLQKRPSSPDRMERINSQVSSCGTNEKVYIERYQSIIGKIN